MLEGINLQALRGDRSLFERLSFKIKAGECLFVQGENGSGKTSLLRVLVGLTPPSDGTVFWKGRPIKLLGDEYRRTLLYCGHLSGLKDELSAMENLVAGAALAGDPVSLGAARDALHESGLRDRQDLPVRFLSQGQKRRVNLARLLLQPRALWILDEPLAALDTKAVRWLAEVIDAHLESGGIAVITSHQSMALASTTHVIRVGV
ncbi:cytochrome c biogenesis heme-transporting ATPase CcmA [Alcaligenaceae bacterium]|nr:cytochrome c biogenesis heme-transporting ATPase CcmA [Alcaligenaceae bacterium]HCP76413.1 cytochrome c biogenesis heme-transporting ATPase CcmA [Pusillimonas sp.]